MQHTSRKWVAVAGLSLVLLAAGCKSGGGGLSSLFGIFGGSGGGDSGGGDVLASLFDVGSSGGTGGSGDTGGVSGVGGSGGEITSPAATVHNPEPGSIALFGTGLLGVAFLRRRHKKA